MNKVQDILNRKETLDFDTLTGLENIQFKYERLTALVEFLWLTVSEAAVEVRGTTEDAFANALFEIEAEMHRNNTDFADLIKSVCVDRRAAV